MANTRIKRSFDILASCFGLLFLSPLFFLCSILIKLNDNGPIFFKQKRVGRGRRVFSLYKFRTMSVLKSAEDGLFEPGNVSRITSAGKFLRKTKLDELPQLINVLKGDMSLVGPRPEVEKWVDEYHEKWEGILSVKPGITDNASIEFRDEEELLSRSSDPEETYRNVILPRKLDLYNDYVKNHRFVEDMRIIFITLKVLMFK